MCVTSRPGPRRSCRRANGSRTRSSKLVSLFQPFAPTEVWQHGHGNLKQLVTEWYKDDPAFAGVEVVAWCKLLKDKDAQPGSTSMVSKFSFEYTPSRKRRSLDALLGLCVVSVCDLSIYLSIYLWLYALRSAGWDCVVIARWV